MTSCPGPWSVGVSLRPSPSQGAASGLPGRPPGPGCSPGRLPAWRCPPAGLLPGGCSGSGPNQRRDPAGEAETQPPSVLLRELRPCSCVHRPWRVSPWGGQESHSKPTSVLSLNPASLVITEEEETED